MIILHYTKAAKSVVRKNSKKKIRLGILITCIVTLWYYCRITCFIVVIYWYNNNTSCQNGNLAYIASLSQSWVSRLSNRSFVQTYKNKEQIDKFPLAKGLNLVNVLWKVFLLRSVSKGFFKSTYSCKCSFLPCNIDTIKLIGTKHYPRSNAWLHDNQLVWWFKQPRCSNRW